MARTITLTPQAVTISNTKVGSIITDIAYTPSLSTTLVDGTPVQYAEGTSSYSFKDSTTGETFFIHQINDDLVTKYG